MAALRFVILIDDFNRPSQDEYLIAIEKPDLPALLVAAVPATIQRVPPRATVQAASYAARTGNQVEIADLERYFWCGYDAGRLSVFRA